MNQFNLEKRIQLLDLEGNLKLLVSQQEAFVLLRNNKVKLLMKKPVSIQAITDDLTLKKRYPRWLHVTQSVIYGNYRVQNPEGEEIFHCNVTKALWYLNRDLVDIISEEPPIIRLKFVPNGNGHAGDKFHLSERKNCCVVCGAINQLNRHHVVPYCYRKFLPENIKSHSYYDILPLCVKCHNEYESKATELKRSLCEKYDVKMYPEIIVDKELNTIIKDCKTLLLYESQIPNSKKEILYKRIETYLNEYPTKEKLIEISKLKAKRVVSEYKFGEEIVKKVNFQEFTEMWRNHFISTMNPKFMPQYWTLDRSYFQVENLA